MRIAICITTRNRPEVLKKSLRQWNHLIKHSRNVRFFIVDDASDNPPPCDFHFTQQAGIPSAKNKCIELAMAANAEHIFLCDDDVYPLIPHALIPYIQSRYKHLCFTFLPSNGTLNSHPTHSLANGCMMYVHREVIETIGGFDTAFGLGKFEHVQFSFRAYASGFIPHPFMDVPNSKELFHSLDQKQEVQRTFTPEQQTELINKNRQHYYDTRMNTNFIPYL